MSFIPNEPTNFLSIRLTNEGRRMLSLGKLKFFHAALSDREIDYEFGVEDDYSHSCNRVLMTKDAAPVLPFMNFDGTPPISLAGNVYSDKKTITASTSSYGIFSAMTHPDYVGTFSGYALNMAFSLASGATDTNRMSGSNLVLISSGTPADHGIVIFAGLKTRLGAGFSTVSGTTSSSLPHVSLGYRYSAVTSQVIALDRNSPHFDVNASFKGIGLIFLPWSGADTYYGTGSTSPSPVWNLNIVRTSTEIGTSVNHLRYTRYGSIEYAGAKKYFDLGMDTRMAGFVHYTNSDTGNTFGEQFMPKTTVIDLPQIIWHRYPCAPGQGTIRGVRFTDRESEIHYDSTAKTPYTLLQEDSFFGSMTVGRVYFKLRIIVFTDPELLTAMSYKSNRNWTLPPLDVTLVKDPKPPLTNFSASGMCESGKTFYVTYRYVANQPFAASQTYGYGPAIHCNYIQKIKGYTDENGLSYYLSAKFPSRSFPMMRKGSEMVAFSGSGWNANKVQLLVAKVDDADDLGLGYVPTNGWVAISNMTQGGNGIFSGSSTSTCIDPAELTSHQFIVSNEDYVSGSTYDLSEHYPDFFTRTDYKEPVQQLGLTYGNETLFLGVIQTVMAATTYKTTWMVTAADTDFNSSLNSTFDGTVNDSTYITEIGIFDDKQRLVGVAKPTWPIRKNQGRYLTFELEFDF